MWEAQDLCDHLGRMTAGDEPPPRDTSVRVIEEPSGPSNWSSVPSLMSPDLHIAWQTADAVLHINCPNVDWTGVPLSNGRRLVVTHLADVFEPV
jgi:hypothetical protein